MTLWNTRKGRVNQVKIQAWIRVSEHQGESGHRRYLERDRAACLCWVGNSGVKSSLHFTLILHVDYELGIWRCPWLSASQFPPSFEAMRMLNCHKVTLKISSNPLRLQRQWMCNVQWHHTGTWDESWLRKEITSYYLTSVQPDTSWETSIHLDEGSGKRESGRSLGKLSNCRNWSIWHCG